MKRLSSLADLADHLDATAFKVGVAPFETAKITAPVLAQSVKDVFGHDPPLATLAESTQIERANLGYSPNEPLVRTGETRESVESIAVFNLAATGSTDPLARCAEDGSPNRPPRPVFLIGGRLALPVVYRIFRAIVGEALGKR